MIIASRIAGAADGLRAMPSHAAAMPRDWSVLQVYFANTIIISLLGWTELARGAALAAARVDLAHDSGCDRARLTDGAGRRCDSEQERRGDEVPAHASRGGGVGVLRKRGDREQQQHGGHHDGFLVHSVFLLC